MSTTSEKLKVLMERNGITCYKLAKGIEVSEPAVHGWLNGTYDPKLQNIKKLSKFFGVPLEYFIGEEEEKNCI